MKNTLKLLIIGWVKSLFISPLIPINENRDDIKNNIITRYIFIILFVLYPNKIINKVIYPKIPAKTRSKLIIIVGFSFK
jgi:hypothetical protein